MCRRSRLIRRFRSLFLKSRVERELDEELRFHLELQIEANVEKGMGHEEARTAALRSFGGVEQTKEACRDERGVRLIEDLGNDLLHGLRILRKSPGFTAVAVLTLALGIGANTAVFSVVDGVLLSRLPFPGSERLVTLWNTYPKLGDEQEEVSPPDFCDWRAQNRSFDQLAAYERFFYILAGDPAPVRLRVARVSGDFFAAMGVKPLLGRRLLPADDHEGAHHVLVLSHRLWTSRFGADPSVVGRTVTLTGMPFAVVGVMPAEFEFPDDAEAWSPMAYEPPFEPNLRRSTWLRTVARLKPGVTSAQAQADMSFVARRLEERYPDTNRGRSVVVVSLFEKTVGNVRPALLVLLGAVGFVLLIACANLVNLLLSRGAARRHEIALRAAIGAGRSRLVRQLVTESLLLGVSGGAGGLLLAWSSLSLLRRLDPGSVPRLQEVTLDLRVLAFAFLVSLAAGVASGIVPALMATRADPYELLKEGGLRAADGPRRRRIRNGLVVTEIALAQVLLVGGYLFFQSFLRTTSVNPGFDPDGLVVGQFELSSQRYATPSARTAFYREAVERVAALPGVQAAALSSTIPLHVGQLSLDFVIEGRPRPLPPAPYPQAGFDSITPEYFRTMRIRLRSGRFFTDADGEHAALVTVINEAMAHRYWPGEDPLGRSIRLHSDSPTDSDPIEVVGVVENVRQMALTAGGRPQFYLPYAQYPWRGCYLLVRSASGPSDLVPAVRREIQRLDAGLALSDFRDMRHFVSASLNSTRFNACLLGVFAVLALTLATGGVFGVVSYSTSQRTRGFAIRTAMGAQRRDIFRLVVADGLRLVVAGIGLGLVLALALTQALASMLFEIVPTDPTTYAVVGIVLGAVALAACCIPARQAMHLDPVVALRQE
jgi:putative ABC transport system permease protein